MYSDRNCGVCGRRLAADSGACAACGRRFHRACVAYHGGFDPRCGRKRWLGTLEF